MAIKCANGHVISSDEKFCRHCGLPMSSLCPNGHRVEAKADFCPECGTPLAAGSGQPLTPPESSSTQVIEAPAVKWSGLPKSSSALLDRVPRQSLLRASILTLVLSTVLTAVTEVIYFPRIVFWLIFSLIVIFELSSVRTVSTRVLVAFYAVAVGAFALDWIVGRAVFSLRELSGSYPLGGARLLAYLGTVSLAFLLLGYFDPQCRQELRSLILPRNTADPMRVGIAVLIALLALAPVIRSFTGPFSFGVVGFNASPFPGYPSTVQVKQFVMNRVNSTYQSGADTDLFDCQYFLPQAGPPPLWHCSIKVIVSGAPAQYHDNLQITGRKDGTFSCYDGSNVEIRLCDD
jgi:hypothetical protein